MGIEEVGCLRHHAIGNPDDVILRMLGCLFNPLCCCIYYALDSTDLALGIVGEELWRDAVGLEGLGDGLSLFQGQVGHCRGFTCDRVYVLDQALKLRLVLFLKWTTRVAFILFIDL